MTEKTNQESLCDRCHDPGMCCRDIFLSERPPGFTKLEALAWLASIEPDAGEIGLPFLPVSIGPHPWDEGQVLLNQCPISWIWKFTCPILTEDGRCGDYENRPNLCKTFEPGVHEPCVMRPDNL